MFSLPLPSCFAEGPCLKSYDGDAEENVDLKNYFIIYLRISRFSKVIYLVYHCQNFNETEPGTRR